MRQATTHHSGFNWYLARLKRMPTKFNSRSVIHFIIRLSNNPVEMEIERALQIFEAARRTGAILKRGKKSWRGNPDWRPL